MGPWAGLVISVLSVGTTMGATLWRRRSRDTRRARLRAQPLPAEWEDHLKRNVALYNRLPPELQEQLRGHVQVFLDEKLFEGCNGVEITDEVRVTVAGLACLLLLNRETDYYPELRSILVYPAAYVVDSPQRDGAVEVDRPSVRLGESWQTGNVVLSWSDVMHPDPRDGHNLTLHEFAHQLDQEDGRSDGVPVLALDSQYDTWAEVLAGEYRQLQKLSEKGRKHLLDAYGATNPAEFFAVATETFFTRPIELAEQKPDLYELLRDFYRQDPGARRRRADNELGGAVPAPPSVVVRSIRPRPR